MQKPFHPEELAGHAIGAAMGGAITAGGAAALIGKPELILHFAWVGFLTGAVSGVLGDLLGYFLVASPASASAGAACLTALIFSAVIAGPMLLLVFILLFERWFDITPLVVGTTGFAGFMAGAAGRLISALTGASPTPGNAP